MKSCFKIIGIIAFLFIAFIVCSLLYKSSPNGSDELAEEARTGVQLPNSLPTENVKTTPKFEVVAKNPNGHKIFIVTQATRKTELIKIVNDYRASNVTPENRWMINFFDNKEKALRVYREWLIPADSDGKYLQLWVYDVNKDHGAIAQWTSWDGLTLDQW